MLFDAPQMSGCIGGMEAHILYTSPVGLRKGRESLRTLLAPVGYTHNTAKSPDFLLALLPLSGCLGTQMHVPHEVVLSAGRSHFLYPYRIEEISLGTYFHSPYLKP